MAASPATQAFPVTISLLPVCLSLVHIPRTRLLQLVHPIVRQILLPSPAFLNLTCNEIELTIFAEHHLLADFEHVARKERQRHRSRSGSTSSRGTQPDLPVDVAVEVSYEKWHVLQIDTHSSGLNSAGARVHEISAPLAAAGISILYQSSYMSDFIFVKASRLKEAMGIFASAGFDVFASDDSILPCTPSGLVSTPFFDGAPSRSPSTSRRKRAPSMTSGGISPVPLESVIELPISELPSTTPQQSCLARSDSLLPSISDVRLLGPDLTCIGLCDESADVWSLKLIKLVAYPELIDAAHVSTPSTIYSLTTSFHMHGMASPVSMSDFSEDEEGYYSASQNERSSSPSSMSGRSFTRSHSLESSSDSRKSSRSARLHPMPSMAELSLLHSDSPPPSAAVHKRHPVPFFSFTRTAEGSSLTAPTTVLATLFPRSERYMVMRGNELDELEDERSPHSGDSDYERDERNTPMRCLQIDLRQFGLDKYGLVNRFSRILEEHGINHMYSSTFKTANLLVDRARASKAKALLRAC